MAIRDRDRAVHRDSLTVLAALPGSAARDLESHHAAILDERNTARRPTETAEAADKVALAEECVRRIDATLQDLATLASTVPSNVLLSVPMLLGQAEFRERQIGPGPNRFDFEIALLRSRASAPTGPFDRSNVAATLRCMALARTVMLLRPIIMVMRQEENPLGNSLLIGGLLERGRFSGYYDLKIAEMIAKRLRDHGRSVDSPRALRRILETFVRTWSGCSFEFYEACRTSRSQFATWLKSRELLAQPEWTDDDLQLVVNHAPSLWLDAAPLLDDPESERWLEHSRMTLPVTAGRPANFDLSQLTGAPVVQAEGKLLLVQPHRFDTDISDVIHRVWGAAFGETYHAARGEVVEEVAYSTLMRLPGARGIPGGHYTSASGRINGESDGVVLWEGHLLLIEAKGGFLSQAARRGDGEAAMWDVRATVGEAFYQASRLLRVLEEDGQVELTAANGSRFRLERAGIDRTYVFIATADDFGNVAVLHHAMEDAGILPRGARPLIAAGQELMLFYDIFTDPLDLIAYLLFREEVLTFKPPIHVADEHEILGGYVAGVDFIAVSERMMRLSPGETGGLTPDPVLQRHIDRWLQERFSDTTRDVPPPARHNYATSALANGLYERGDLQGALTVRRASRHAADEAPHRVATHVGRRATLSPGEEVAVVTASTEAPLRILRRQVDWVAANRARQIWAFKRYGRTPPELYAALTTGATEPGAYELLPTVVRADLGSWYEKVDAKRRRGFDETVVIALEQEGLPPSTGIGVCRMGLVDHVRAAVQHGADIQKVAALWLGPVKSIADSRGIAVAEVPIESRHVAEIVDLLRDHKIRKDQVPGIVEAAIDHSRSPVESAREVEIWDAGAESHRSAGLAAVVSDVVSAEAAVAARAAAGESKATRYLLGQVMRRMSPPPPSPEDVVAALQVALQTGPGATPVDDLRA